LSQEITDDLVFAMADKLKIELLNEDIYIIYQKLKGMTQFTAVNHLIGIQLQDVKDSAIDYTKLNNYQVSYLCQCSEYLRKSS